MELATPLPQPTCLQSPHTLQIQVIITPHTQECCKLSVCTTLLLCRASAIVFRNYNHYISGTARASWPVKPFAECMLIMEGLLLGYVQVIDHAMKYKLMAAPSAVPQRLPGSTHIVTLTSMHTCIKAHTGL